LALVLVDASVARSFAVIDWSHHLIQVCGGKVLLADGVHGAKPEDPSELRRIRDALSRQAEQAGLGSGVASRALAAVQGLDHLLALPPEQLSVLKLNEDELELAVRLQSRHREDQEWRRSLGTKARRLDAGESASIAIAVTRSLEFASDDEDALAVWRALTGRPGHRTLDLFKQLVGEGAIEESDAKSRYEMLQSDDLHNLGGPAW